MGRSNAALRLWAAGERFFFVLTLALGMIRMSEMEDWGWINTNMGMIHPLCFIFCQLIALISFSKLCSISRISFNSIGLPKIIFCIDL